MKFTLSLIAAAAVASTDAQGFTTGRFLGWSCKNNCGKSNRGFHDQPNIPAAPTDPDAPGVTITRRAPAPVQAQNFAFQNGQFTNMFNNNLVFNNQGQVFQNNGANVPTQEPPTAAPAAANTNNVVFQPFNGNVLNNQFRFTAPSAINTQFTNNQPLIFAGNVGGQTTTGVNGNVLFRSGKNAEQDDNEGDGEASNRQANNGGVLFANNNLMTNNLMTTSNIAPMNNQFFFNNVNTLPLNTVNTIPLNAAPIDEATAAPTNTNLFLNGQNSIWANTQWANTGSTVWAPQWAPTAAVAAPRPTAVPVPTKAPCIQGQGFGGCCSCDAACTANGDCCNDYKYWCEQGGIPLGAPAGWGTRDGVTNVVPATPTSPATPAPPFRGPTRVPSRNPQRGTPTERPAAATPAPVVATPRPSAATPRPAAPEPTARPAAPEPTARPAAATPRPAAPEEPAVRPTEAAPVRPTEAVPTSAPRGGRTGGRVTSRG